MTLISIGELARLTHVSVKRLRHYHDTGVLVAARVDESYMLGPAEPLVAEHRALPPMTGLAATARVSRDGITAWCGETFAQLYARLGARLPAGPDGATYGEEFFTDDLGPVTVYVPVLDGDDVTILPGGHFAVAVHEGSFTGMDRTCSRLGRHVAEAGIGLTEPIRESYVVGPPDITDAAPFRTARRKVTSGADPDRVVR